jgi:CHAD domain-containing protein
VAKAPRYDGLSAELPLRDAARIILRALYEASLEHAPAVLRGDDTRAVHDMRVAIRRLRSGLTTFAGCFPASRARAMRHATRRVGRKLGLVRDADVHLAALRGTLGGASASERPGLIHAVELLLARRRAALAAFAIELSQLDRSLFERVLSDG